MITIYKEDIEGILLSSGMAQCGDPECDCANSYELWHEAQLACGSCDAHDAMSITYCDGILTVNCECGGTTKFALASKADTRTTTPTPPTPPTPPST